MRLLFASLVAAAVLAVVPFQAPAVASAAARITGVVVDQTGAPVPGAIVELRSDAGQIGTTMTDRAGKFDFDNVAPGSYTVRASLGGLGVSTLVVTVGDRPALSVLLVLQPRWEQAAKEVRDATILVQSGEFAAMAPPMPVSPMYSRAGMSAPMFNTESYARIDENSFHRVADEPLSTFSIDVDTASYANVRRFLNDGALPPADAVRIEELINYFHFDYPAPKGSEPFSVITEIGPCPWNGRHRLALIGLQARRIEAGRTPPRNLVFLLDVSGSMATPDKLPLVKTAMRMLADTLTAADKVAIVVYAGSSGVALPSTPGNRLGEIKAAIAELRPGGSTNGAAGIRLAYDIAQRSFVEGGINRVILATDGDFNVGVSSPGELTRLIEQERQRGIFLSVLGVGTGNLKDSTMEQLADRGNGNYAYLDSLDEARRVLVGEAGGTLAVVAKDVKIQVEFNPRLVGGYKLIGYENRVLQNRDFNDDTKDAGEIGAGHTVTALYEIVPVGESLDGGSVDPLKYQSAAQPNAAAGSGELMTVKLRYKEPDGEVSRLRSVTVREGDGRLGPRLGFAAAVAEFGLLLRRSDLRGDASWASALDLARTHRGPDRDGYRAELARLIELAAALERQQGGDEPVPDRPVPLAR